MLLIIGTIVSQLNIYNKVEKKSLLFESLVKNLESLNICYIYTTYDKEMDKKCLLKLGDISRQLDDLPNVVNEALIYGGTYRYLSALTLKEHPVLFERLKFIAKNEEEIESTDIDYTNFLSELRDKYHNRIKISRKKL